VTGEIKSAGRIVLLGAGHSHAELLSRWRARHPRADVVLVNDGNEFVYSARIPRVVAGEAALSSGVIDIARTARAADVTFENARVTAIDRAGKVLMTSAGRSIPYDILSVNAGAAPMPTVGGRDRAITVKPWRPFLAWWARFLIDARRDLVPRSLAVVGGSAGGVEIALALARRVASADVPVRIALVESRGRVAPELSLQASSHLRGRLRAAGVEVHRRARGAAMLDEGGGLLLHNGSVLAVDAAIWVAGSRAPALLAEAGLDVDERGAVRCHATLQSLTDPSIFVAGDCAGRGIEGRTPAGVQAVHDGRLLAYNLPRALKGNSLKARPARRSWMSIVDVGHGEAVADYGVLAIAGARARIWKDRLDEAFLARVSVPREA